MLVLNVNFCPIIFTIFQIHMDIPATWPLSLAHLLSHSSAPYSFPPPTTVLYCGPNLSSGQQLALRGDVMEDLSQSIISSLFQVLKTAMVVLSRGLEEREMVLELDVQGALEVTTKMV